MIDRVTITGADDSVDPLELVCLAAEFPFVEWGALISESHTGEPRYPSHDWISRFQTFGLENPLMRTALHVCGRWAKKLLIGQTTFETWLTNGFERIQLNFDAATTPFDPYHLWLKLQEFGKRQWIVQVDASGSNAVFEAIHGHNDPDFCYVDAVPLFDCSGGHGVLPLEWPKPFFFDHMEEVGYHGYAGGLRPENLAAQIPLIEAATASPVIDLEAYTGESREASERFEPRVARPYWIDMESGVRTNNQFDLAKVRQVLEIAAPFVVRPQ
jgi:hypothetical protein